MRTIVMAHVITFIVVGIVVFIIASLPDPYRERVAVSVFIGLLVSIPAGLAASTFIEATGDSE